MKILQLGKFYPVKGGVEKVMFDLTTGLAARGIDCDMMCAESSGRGVANRLSPHAQLLTCRTWVKAASTTIFPSMPVSLRKIAHEYDIVHVHHPDPMAALALFASGYKGKVVLHWHSDIVKQKKLMHFYMPLQSWLLKRADVIIGTTADYIRQSPYLAPVRHKTVCVPIGVAPIAADEEGAKLIRSQYSGKKIVYFLGRLIPYKGCQYLIDAAAHLSDDYVVLIGGEGPLHADLQSQIDRMGLNDKVFMLGMVPDEKISAYYTACDVFCLPSVMQTEAFGIVQIEAMSLGKPVVATRIAGSGTAWVNAHGQSGLNVAVKDAKALANAITQITSKPESYERFSSGARKRFETLFELNCMIDNCIKIYQSLL